MANMLFANNANTTLASSLSAGATSMSVTSATNFPSPTGVQYFYCTLADAATQTTIEIVKVTSVTGTTFAITRAQDGTSATAFASGAVVSLRLVRASLNDFPKLDETNTFNADQAISGQLTSSAGLATTGTFTATAPSDGLVMDFATGFGRFSAFAADGFQWYNAGIANTKLMQLSSTGVITTATWNGATVGVAYGGTGVTSATGTGAGASVVLSQAPAINSPVITAYSTSTVPLKVYGLSGQITELFDVYTYNGGTLAFQINSNGAIATGTWNGSVIGATYGGTGEAGTLTGILYGNGTSAHTVATTAQLLSGIGTLPVANGGTGLTSLTAGYIPYGNGTSAFSSSSNLYFSGTKLGVGTSTPQAVLSVTSADNSTSLFLTPTSGTGSGVYTQLAFGNTPGSASVYGGIRTAFTNPAATSSVSMQFWTDSGSSTYAERMRITQSGGVAIGTTTDPGAGALAITGSAYVGAGVWIPNTNYFTLLAKSATPTAQYYFYDTSIGFFAYPDNTCALGNASYRWTTVYATTALINTSDANTKQQITDLTIAELATAKAIKKLIKSYKFNDSVKEKGDNARIHIGVIAQEIEGAFIANGLDASKYAMFCSDTWYEVDGQAKEDGGDFYTASSLNAVAVTRLGIRYEELLAFVISSL
jgi:hypothetical protein